MQAFCPICKKKTDERDRHRPFCSARCKDIDLGHWLGESYRVSRPMMPWEVEAVDDDDEPKEPSPYLN